MPAAPTGTIASSTSSQTTLQKTKSPTADSESRSTPSQAHSTKRNHSVVAATDSTSQASSTHSEDATTPAQPTHTTAGEEERSSGTPFKKMRAEEASIKDMPLDYSTCETRDLVLLISSMLMELVRYNDTIPLRDGQLTRFHSRAPLASACSITFGA